MRKNIVGMRKFVLLNRSGKLNNDQFRRTEQWTKGTKKFKYKLWKKHQISSDWVTKQTSLIDSLIKWTTLQE